MTDGLKTIGAPGDAYADDVGEPSDGVREALARREGADDYLRSVAALCAARLFLPLLPGDDGEMAAISVTASDGRRALLVFTGADSLVEWRSDARPVPATLDDLAATVAEAGADALLIDAAGPWPLVIEGDILANLAAGRRLVALDEASGGGFGWLVVQPGK